MADTVLCSRAIKIRHSTSPVGGWEEGIGGLENSIRMTQMCVTA